MGESKQNSTKQINNNNRKQEINHYYLQNVCRRWINHKCWKGEDCTSVHPTICESDVYLTACKENPCNLYHPQVCSTNSRGKVCLWGEGCTFRHLLNDVQGYSHENNRHRQDSHYKHYGNHYDRYGDQNNYRYGDGPDDSWNYGRSNGRQQNKRALHNQNIAYRGHVNSHQGLQTH